MIKKIGFYSFIVMIVAGFAACSNTTANNRIDNEEVIVKNEITETPEEEVDETPEKLLKISTEYGDMVVKLYNGTPLHRDNFIKLAQNNFYNGLIFHRVINAFMIQGGDPASRNAAPGQMLGNGGPGYTIPAEFNKKYFHKKGALAAAREGDDINPEKASSGSQFYIVQGKKYSNMEINTLEQQMQTRIPWENKEVYMKIGGTPHLDQNYTVFGEVITGFEVIDKIAAVQADRYNRPIQDIKMTVTVIED